MPLAAGSSAGDGSDAVGGRDAASMGLQPVIGPAASDGQTPVVVAQAQAGPSPRPTWSGPPIRIHVPARPSRGSPWGTGASGGGWPP